MQQTKERELVLDIEGMTCASCVTKIERALGELESVESAAVNLATRTATIRTSSTQDETMIRAVQSVGYGARPHTEERSASEEEHEYVRRLVVAIAFTVPVVVLSFTVPHEAWAMRLAWALATPVQFYAGWPFLRGAFRAARHRTTTMDTLVAMGSLAAYVYSAYAVAADRP